MTEKWNDGVTQIEIELNNKHGGTYIVNATATYEVDGKQQSCQAQVSGGLVKTMPSIPLRAKELALELVFKGIVSSDTYNFKWPFLPSKYHRDGKIVIDLRGVWPGKTSATDRLAVQSS